MAIGKIESGPQILMEDMVVGVGTALAVSGAVCCIHYDDASNQADVVASLQKAIDRLLEVETFG